MWDMCINVQPIPHGVQNIDEIKMTGPRSVLYALILAVVHIAVSDAVTCNGRPYDRAIHICCQNQLIVLPEGANTNVTANCCGSVAYIATTQICCNWSSSIVLPKPTLKHQCCGNSQVYNPVNQTCCSTGTIVKKPYDCCGDALFSYKTHMCCSGQIKSKPSPENTYAAGSTNDCRRTIGLLPVRDHFNAIFQSQLSCCGTEPFFPHTHICCENNIQMKPRCFASCCGSMAYSNLKHLCCNGVLQSRRIPHRSNDILQGRSTLETDSYSCCGQSSYDRRSALCCDGINVLDKPDDNYKCCGRRMYSTLTHFCCSGTTIRRQFDSLKACNNIIKWYTGCSPSCCGSTAYSTLENLCCNGTLLSRPSRSQRGDRFSCCGQSTYDQGRELCCKGTVLSKLTNRYQCCGAGTYNSVTHLCCNGETMPMKYGPLTVCCGSTIYNKETQFCTVRKVVFNNTKK